MSRVCDLTSCLVLLHLVVLSFSVASALKGVPLLLLSLSRARGGPSNYCIYLLDHLRKGVALSNTRHIAFRDGTTH